MLNRKYFITILLFVVWAQFAVGQDTTGTIGNVSIASPTAASLGKYGDIPVSYNTGIPNISIPIYTVESGSLKLPISLSYHASGLKIQENASWVGAGWALNAGGMITRTVVGAPDDRGIASANICTNGYYSDSGYNNYLWITKTGAFGSTWDGYWADDISFCQGFKDGEPDLYFFNFGGYTGKFYFNDDRTPILVPEEDFKIQPDLNNSPTGLGFQGFIVTTPDGVKWYFGMTGNNNTSVAPIERSSPTTLLNNLLSANQVVSSWFLNKIVSADGIDSITFTYQPENYSYYTLSMFPVSNIVNPGAAPSDLNGYNLVKDFVQGVRLSQITFPNGSVTFTKTDSPRTDLSAGYAAGTGMYDYDNTDSSAAYALGSITIANTAGFCKKDSFYFGYFHDANATGLNPATYSGLNIHTDSYKLRLDSIKETSCDGTASVPPYRFTYYSELVPRGLSFGIDHWGFSNGVTTNQGLIPTYSYIAATGGIVQVVPGANRDASWPAMRGGALQQISYPTGGYTQFTYQPNDTYVNYTKYTATSRASMSAGYDGHNGTLGDGGDNPDTATFTTAGNTLRFILQNSSGGGSGELEIFNAGTNTLVLNVGGADAGQTDTFYNILAPGRYWAELTKSSATSGHGITATITENIGTGVSGTDTVGGLRIGTIAHYDGWNANPIVTNYSYTTGGSQSSGILYSRPVYVQSIRNDMYGIVYSKNNPGSGDGCINTPGTYYVSPTSISPMQTVQGNHIGYNQVQVSQSGNGYSIYRYYGSNYWDNIISDVCTRTLNTSILCTVANIPNFPAAPLPFDPMRGELKYEGHFSETGKILKEATYTPVYVFDSLTTPGDKSIDIPGLYSATFYQLQSAKKVQTTTVSTLYDQAGLGSVTSTNTLYYGSNFHHQPTRKVSTTSTGDSLASNTLYAMDLRIASCDAIPDSLPYYLNTVHTDSANFFIADTLCAASDWACRLDTLSKMRRLQSLARMQYVRYRARNFSGSGNVQATCYASAENSGDTLLKAVLRLQDEFNNAPIEVSNWRDNLLLHANFTQYDTSQSPVGFAYPARTQLINLQTPSAAFSPVAISGSTLARDSRYLDESKYTFNAGNPLQVTPHNGVTTAYIWDYLAKEPIAKVTGTTVDQVAYTSFEADGSGSWTVASGARDTGSITGSACYNLSSGAVSRSGLSGGSIYVVSYWSKSGHAYTVSGSTAVVQGKTTGGWTYFEHAVTGVSSVSVSGAGDIDELRLYPRTAQMTTYTYTPLVGMSSQCDVDNRVTYYSYDALGRLNVVRDQDGNIVKTVGYHYKNQ